MKNKFCILLLVLLSMSILGNVEAKPFHVPTLSKKEMKQDVDFLVRAIKEIDPYIAIRSQVTGVDIYAEIDSLYAKVNKLKDFESFYYLCQQIMKLCQDPHLDFQGWYPEGMEDSNFYISPRGLERSDFCTNEYGLYSVWNSMGFSYVNGDYYVLNPILNPDNLAVIIPSGAQLTALSGISIQEYLEKWNRRIDCDVRWDAQNRKYYSYNLYPPWVCGLNKPNDYNYTFTYKYGDSTFIINKTPFMMECQGCSEDNQEAKVFWMEKEKLLYIRIPDMDYEFLPLIQEGIKAQQHQNIEKVVIDIRGNQGGSDEVWQTALSEIIDLPLIYEAKYYSQKSQLSLDYFKYIRHEQLDTTTVYLNNKPYISRSNDNFMDTIYPSPTSIQYKGKINVLTDRWCFSSSLAFIKVCDLSDKLVTVGEPTGCIKGCSTTPLYMSLPNSKLIFRITPTLDLSNVKKPEDLYNSSVDMEVKSSLEETIFRANYRGKIYSEDFLLQHDPVFRAVLAQ